MIVPGSNLLNLALSVIAKQTVMYYKNTDRAINSIGLDIAEYDSPVAIKGSVQPVRRSLYEKNGLDFQRRYVTFYASTKVIDITRDLSGDQFSWNGRQWQVLSTNDWYAQDGWTGILAVDIKAAVSTLTASFGFDADHLNYDNGNFYAG